MKAHEHPVDSRIEPLRAALAQARQQIEELQKKYDHNKQVCLDLQRYLDLYAKTDELVAKDRDTFGHLREALMKAEAQIEELKRERDEQKIPKELKRYDFADCVDRCPECDGQSFISAGGMNYVCHICFLLLENDKLEKQLAQAQKERNDYFADIHRLSGELKELQDAVAQARREGMLEAVANKFMLSREGELIASSEEK